MDEIIERIRLKIPKILSNYSTESVSNNLLPSCWNQGYAFVTKKLCCSCGASQLHLLSTPKVETKGIFKKTKVITHLAPIHTKCGACGIANLLLNPEVHGWSGELNDSAALVGSGEPQHFASSQGEVYVNYSYQGTENYKELEQENVQNLEDYFDTITVYFKSADSAQLEEVVSYECA